MQLTSQLRRFKEKYRERSRDEEIGDYFDNDDTIRDVESDIEEPEEDSEEEVCKCK